MVSASEEQSLIHILEEETAVLYTPENKIGRGGEATVYRTGPTTAHKVTEIDTFPKLRNLAVPGIEGIPFSFQGSSCSDYPSFLVIGKEYFTLPDQKILRGIYEGQILQDLRGAPYVVDSAGYRLCVDYTGKLMVVTSLELLPGKNLETLIKRELNVYEVAMSLANIALALQCIHKLGIVHRDVKPGNINYSSSTGEATLFDFGIAKNTVGYGQQENVSVPVEYHRLLAAGDADVPGTICGTLSFMSKEHMLGINDPSMDIFSLGLTAFVAFTGEYAFPYTNAPRDHIPQLLRYDNHTREEFVDRFFQLSKERHGIEVPKDLLSALRLVLDEEFSERRLQPFSEAMFDFAQCGDKFQKTYLFPVDREENRFLLIDNERNYLPEVIDSAPRKNVMETGILSADEHENSSFTQQAWAADDTELREVLSSEFLFIGYDSDGNNDENQSLPTVEIPVITIDQNYLLKE